jgi:glutamate racemase
MSIGVFDSGVGGLSVHRALVERLPAADFVYLADQAAPSYGSLPGETIVDLTRAGCVRLFDQGVSLVVLACNTASAIALRRLQQTWLPGYRAQLGRRVNILGIIVPTIEAATGVSWQDQAEQYGDKIEAVDVIGVFSTAATAASRVYEIEIDKRRQDVAVFSEPCPGLARMIEDGADTAALKATIAGHVAALTRHIGRAPDRAILGCTHYEIVAPLFVEALPAGVAIIHQPTAVADALELYLKGHPDYPMGTGGSRRFLTTGEPRASNGLVETFWGSPVRFERA